MANPKIPPGAPDNIQEILSGMLQGLRTAELLKCGIFFTVDSKDKVTLVHNLDPLDHLKFAFEIYQKALLGVTEDQYIEFMKEMGAGENFASMVRALANQKTAEH